MNEEKASDQINDIFQGKDDNSSFGAIVGVAMNGSHLVVTVVAYGIRMDFAMPPEAALSLGHDLVNGARKAKELAMEDEDELPKV